MLNAGFFPEKWPVVSLGDAVTFLDNLRKPVKASDRVEGDYLYYGANGVQGTINEFIFDEPLLLLAEDGGHFGNPDRDIAYIAQGKYWVNNHAHVLKPNAGLDLNFLYRVLQRYDVTPFIKGATRAKLTKGDAETIPIPLPPLAEQQRIAAILDKADAIRRKRQQAIQLADEFLRAVFLDMFGDPITNPKEWEVRPLADVAKITTGNTPSRAEASYYGDHIEWIKSDNINTPSHFLTKAAEHLSEEGMAAGRVVPEGSILVTCIAGSFDCIGNAAIADRPVSFNQQINALTPKPNVNRWFLYSLILFSKKLIQSASTNSMKGMVSKGSMEKIEVIFPPEDLQVKFEKLFQGYLKSMNSMCDSAEKLSESFNSLSQKAFKGEL